jgi:hypothetical protein
MSKARFADLTEVPNERAKEAAQPIICKPEHDQIAALA